MYRVIQVADGQLDGQTEGTSAISGYPATQSMTQVGASAGCRCHVGAGLSSAPRPTVAPAVVPPLQAVIQGAFTSEDAVETEATATETHYTYFPTTAVADTSTSAGAGTTATAVVTTQNSEALLGQPTPTGTAVAGGLSRPCPSGPPRWSWSPPRGVLGRSPPDPLSHFGPFRAILRDDVTPGGAAGRSAEVHRPPCPPLLPVSTGPLPGSPRARGCRSPPQPCRCRDRHKGGRSGGPALSGAGWVTPIRPGSRSEASPWVPAWGG